MKVSVYLVQWTFTNISKPQKLKQSMNYFGRRVSVLMGRSILVSSSEKIERVVSGSLDSKLV